MRPRILGGKFHQKCDTLKTLLRAKLKWNHRNPQSTECTKYGQTHETDMSKTELECRQPQCTRYKLAMGRTELWWRFETQRGTKTSNEQKPACRSNDHNPYYNLLLLCMASSCLLYLQNLLQSSLLVIGRSFVALDAQMARQLFIVWKRCTVVKYRHSLFQDQEVTRICNVREKNKVVNVIRYTLRMANQDQLTK